MEDIVLYHGSRGGIKGEIQPISRVRCDFGKGFYMGESQEQVKGLIADDTSPIFYTVKFKLSEIPMDRILVLDGMNWVYAVLANRKRIPEFNDLALAKKWLEKFKQYDVIIGPIADDRMNVAMQEYADYNLTDVGLLECLKYVDYGRQFVARTEFACSKIEVLLEHTLEDKELEEVDLFSKMKRVEGKNIVKQTKAKFRGNGMYLDTLIAMEQEKEQLSLKPISSFGTIVDGTER